MKLTQLMKRKKKVKMLPVQVMVPEALHDAVEKQLREDDLTWSVLLRSSMKLYLAERDVPVPEIED